LGVSWTDFDVLLEEANQLLKKQVLTDTTTPYAPPMIQGK
jgi:hypothetical protein